MQGMTYMTLIVIESGVPVAYAVVCESDRVWAPDTVCPRLNPLLVAPD